MLITRPLLSATIDDTNISSLRYPLLATPKLDGIRCLIVNGKAVSRTFKPIPNRFIRKYLEDMSKVMGFNWLDGELIVGETFQSCSSGVMSHDGEPDFTYNVFDCKINESMPYYRRIDYLPLVCASVRYCPIYPIRVDNREQLERREEEFLANGYEGMMLRRLDSPYKCGRSTMKEQYLMKLKRFHDAEAVVIGFEELMVNCNSKERDNFGLAERSSSLVNMSPAGTLGALKVRDIKSNVEFKIGTGFTEVQRFEIWRNRDCYIDKVLTYKSQLCGVKDKPRCPVFLRWRVD